MNLDKKILDKIERENIRIKPRWFFVLKDAFLWLGAIILEIGASLFLGMAILFAVKSDSYYMALFLAVIFALLFFWGFRRFFEAGFRQLYKLGFAAVFLALFMANGALGYVFWESGSAQNMENQIKETAVYRKIEPVFKKTFNSQGKDEENSKNPDANLDKDNKDGEKDKTRKEKDKNRENNNESGSESEKENIREDEKSNQSEEDGLEDKDDDSDFGEFSGENKSDSEEEKEETDDDKSQVKGVQIKNDNNGEVEGETAEDEEDEEEEEEEEAEEAEE